MINLPSIAFWGPLIAAYCPSSLPRLPFLLNLPSVPQTQSPSASAVVTAAWLLLRCDGLDVNEENEGRREVAVEEEEPQALLSMGVWKARSAPF